MKRFILCNKTIPNNQNFRMDTFDKTFVPADLNKIENMLRQYEDKHAKPSCPICMDDIEETTKNCVTTKCGHVFHTSCLMQSIAHNGFGCPYCRTVMAEVPKDEYEYSESEYSDESDDEINEEDDILTSFRMFHQCIRGEEIEEEEDEETIVENVDLPNATYVVQKLMERGITYEDLVKKILFECDIYNEENETVMDDAWDNYEEQSTDISYKLDDICREYSTTVQPPQPSILDFDAQAKVYIPRLLE